MKKILTTATICLLVPMFLHAQVQAPEGWRFPEESDYADDWIEYKQDYPVPFHVKADFNGDEMPDDAWILILKKGNSGGLCVFLARKNAPPDVIWLDKGAMVFKPQWVGIIAVPPGRYKTTCGKGYFECGAGEPEELNFSLPAFEVIYFGKASIMFWWNRAKGSFDNTAISD